MKTSSILVIDDEPHMRTLTAHTLRRGGYENLTFARNGREGLELAGQINPDLIIMDYMMPELNGLGALQALKAAWQTSSIPVIMVSGCGELHALRDPVSLGAAVVLTKPYSPMLLLEHTDNILSTHQPTLPA